MSHQSTLASYFKIKASPAELNNAKNNKRSRLSLKRNTAPNDTHLEINKEVTLVEKLEQTISLLSDSDDEPTPPKRQNENVQPTKEQNISSSQDTFPSPGTTQARSYESTSDTSNSSATTILINLSPGLLMQSPKTPSKMSSSPRSSGKFYSPTKKRIVTKKSLHKRNLANEFNGNNLSKPNIDNKPTAHFEKQDKTEFLLEIIDKYRNSDSLKHLLEETSQDILDKCMQVVKPGMTLMCRLYWRQHTWYCMEGLRDIAGAKKDILSSPDLYKMVTFLVENGLIIPSESEGVTKMDLDDYTKLLKRPILLQICKDLKLKINSKQDAVQALRSFCKLSPISNFCTGEVKNNHTRVLKILKSRAGICYKISDLARTTFYNLYLLMYLGIDYSIIRDKKLEWTILYDKIEREVYPVDKNMDVDDASIVFQTKEDFYRYLEAHIMYENYFEITNTNEKCRIILQSHKLYKEVEQDDMLRYKLLPVWLRRFTPPNIYVKIMENGVQELKKMKTEEYYKHAVEILDTLIGQIAFKQHNKAEWYAEKALILHNHLDSSEQAAKALLDGFKSDLSDDSKDAMRPRALKIANQQNIDLKEEFREALRSHATKESILEGSMPREHIWKQPMDNYNQRGKLKFEAFTKNGRATLTAEDYCVLYYVEVDQQFTHGEHWEGRIVSTIFFTLFWDIIYSKPRGITGIFMNHYQRYPLDMFSENFYINRKTLIDERLIFIEECTDDMLIEMLQSKWQERPECEISDIKGDIGWENLRMVTSCLGPRPVAALCRRLAINYGYTRSGFPDLTLWNIHTKKIKFVEVKTDADKPSVKQLQWLRYLTSHGIDAALCYIGVNTTRPKARASCLTFSNSQSSDWISQLFD